MQVWSRYKSDSVELVSKKKVGRIGWIGPYYGTVFSYNMHIVIAFSPRHYCTSVKSFENQRILFSQPTSKPELFNCLYFTSPTSSSSSFDLCGGVLTLIDLREREL